ncbi:serine/threonine-protein kinase [Phycisphaeraceae bacterium D3-23]
MSVRCPHCEHKFALKAAPGVYEPKCPDCGEAFALVIPRESGGRIVVGKSIEHLKRRQAKRKASQQTQASAADAPTVASNADDMRTVASAADMRTVASSPAEMPTMAAPGADPYDAGPNADGGGAETPMGRLDGYELLRELGKGGMGCVYLARQVALDRHVAVKTIAPQLSRSPAFLARFVREAFAVAQLSHHNVVQIHDVGHDDDQHYFSMEYVHGRSLADVMKQHGKLDPAQAATHILHAARGLAYAHEHHMVHRDVKPANLLVNDQGLVKVVDLGLVKTADGESDTAAELGGADTAGGDQPHTTRVAATLGTPAFMPPEQAKDAASVDARADIYALGATFYYLVTGRPPFEARTADEVLKMHATKTVKPPEQRVKRVPAELSAVMMKMLAKRPADRYATMGEVVSALEGYLGIGKGAFTPRPEHATALEDAVDGFISAPAVKVRRGMYIAFHLAALLATVAGILLGNYTLTGTTVWLWLCTTGSYLALSNMRSRSTLGRRVRQYLHALSWTQWFMLGGGLVTVTAMVFVLGLVLYYLAVVVVGLGLAAGFYFVIDKWVAKQRGPIIDGVRRMLRDMRLRGLDEKALRRFVCAYSGRRWEPLYEALFGYEAKREARMHWGFDAEGNPRPRHAGWRDGLIDWLEQHQEEREEDRRRHQLQRAEMQRLRAEGVSDMEAMAKSRQMSRDWFDDVARYRATRECSALAQVYLNQPVTVEEAPASQTDEPIPDSWKLRRTPLSTTLAYWFFAGRARALAGATLLVVWALWATKREKLPSLPEDGGYLQHIRSYLMADRQPLRYQPIPDAVFDVLCSQPALLAGLILVWSGLYQGIRMTVFLLPIVVILLRAPFLGDTMWGPMTHQEWAIIGALALTPPAIFFGKSEY